MTIGSLSLTLMCSKLASPNFSLNKNVNALKFSSGKSCGTPIWNNIPQRAKRDNFFYTKEDLCFSVQETIFAMLVEISERALSHIGKKELLLGGGVGCNQRLQEMCRIMCHERHAKFFVPSRDLLVDNGAMIAFLGEIMFKAGIKFSGKKAEELDIKPRQRTDEVNVTWK